MSETKDCVPQTITKFLLFSGAGSSLVRRSPSILPKCTLSPYLTGQGAREEGGGRGREGEGGEAGREGGRGGGEREGRRKIYIYNYTCTNIYWEIFILKIFRENYYYFRTSIWPIILITHSK